MEGEKGSIDVPRSDRNGKHKVFDKVFSALFVQLPNKLQNHLKLDKLAKDNDELKSENPSFGEEKGPSAGSSVDLEKQLQAWRENPSWDNQPPEIKVGVPKGSLCSLKTKLDVGLPPDAVYDILTDPDSKRIFKNIKEVISRKVLVDEGQRQLVEVEQAALWRFLWWSGTISVRVLVDQNREDHSMKFKQVNTGFMKKFEGRWRIEPVFVDEEICYPFKPKTLAEYCSCSGGKGRIGSKVNLDQLVQPAIAPPPPISWYLRGITAKTTEMLINDLLAEAARLTGGHRPVSENSKERRLSNKRNEDDPVEHICNIKERWSLHRRNTKQHRKKLLNAESF
ncbi:mov34 family protein [Hibiscus syriacus]|uniref:Mov34 family protein n=1 Tax=Hibiscus syriacus TaxID=106335 RepID=A0A6A2ZGH7_HIBSY|nr:mov34 family protein [Hibiscus syriacus]